MASTTARLQADVPAPTGFSYAQAAKGRPTSTATSDQSSGPSSVKDMPNGVSAVNGLGGHDSDRTLNGVTFKSISLSKDAELKQPVSASTTAPSSPTTGSVATKDDDGSVPQAPSDASWEKLSQSSLLTEATDKTKTTKTTKDGEKELDADEKEVKSQETLVAAPVPSVNIWQQRKEAFSAKVKVSPPTTAATMVLPAPFNGISTAKPSTEGLRKARDETEKTPDASSLLNTKMIGKKPVDNTTRAKEDVRRVAPRGSRVDKELPGSQLPPPVEDVVSWPTPETVADEERKKVQDKPGREEKEEKDDGSKAKRPKEKWVHVPYTPSVTFNTPLPTRGGRGRGGARAAGREGRGSHASNGAAGGEKAGNASTGGGADGRERGREGSNGRASSMSAKRDDRVGGDRGMNGVKADGSVDGRRAGSSQPGDVESRHARSGFLKSSKADGLDSGADGDRRGDSTVRNTDHDGAVKDAYQPRERGESRSERGRGGFRGRSGHNFAGHHAHAYANGHAQSGPNMNVRPGGGPFSPPVQQQGHFAGNNYARGRGGARPQPGPGGMYGRYQPNGAMQIPPLQTNGMMDFQGMHPMSAMPYNPILEQYSLLAMVSMQIEYYFSIDNLCKDIFLRKHMDSQGFVFLSFIADFKRIRSLTPDVEILRFACQNSELLEIVQGDDGVDRVRRIEGWEKWLVPMAERDPSARNNGPGFYQRIAPHPRSQSMGARMPMPGHQAMSPPAYSPNGHDANFRAYSLPGPHMNGVNGVFPGETPLSAAVPDFAPGMMPPVDPSNYDIDTTHADDEMDKLTLMWRKSNGLKTSAAAPEVNATEPQLANGTNGDETHASQ